MVKSEFSDGVIICSFDQPGKLNAINSEEAKSEIGRHFDDPGARLILDLKNINFIDSSGFGALLSIMKRARNNNGTLFICNIKPDVMVLFKLLQLHQVFNLGESVEECKKKIEQTSTPGL